MSHMHYMNVCAFPNKLLFYDTTYAKREAYALKGSRNQEKGARGKNLKGIGGM